jgi:4-amino-4-deoxy-L-arabinose transferase-like glycosyltransferase
MGFSAKSSLLLTAIIAFQPRFSIYTAAINYDALLIPLFTLFVLGGVLALKNGPNWKNVLLIVASVYLGILTKQTAYILLVGAVLLFAYLLYEKIKNKSRGVKYAACLLIVIGITVFSIYLKQHLIGNTDSFGDLKISVSSYLSKSLTMGRFALSSRTYWGALGWVNNWFLDNLTNFIWYTQIVAAIGLVLFLILKKKQAHMPEKKYIIFLIVMIALLQLGIRTADWIVFRQTGSLDLGTPGRYFLPNLAAHIILVFTGIGMLLRKEKIFEWSLIIGLILMMTFMMYIIFDTIIFRYYI